MAKKIKKFNDFDFPKRIEHFKNTKDNWYGNYNGNQVKLIYHGVINPYIMSRFNKNEKDKKFTYRVSVWGNDDTGMFKDFDNHLDAKRMFNKIDSMKYVNKEDVLNLGLEYF
jgi:hypothetical protein